MILLIPHIFVLPKLVPDIAEHYWYTSAEHRRAKNASVWNALFCSDRYRMESDHREQPVSKAGGACSQSPTDDAS